MKRTLSLLLGSLFVFGTVAFAQDSSAPAPSSPDQSKSEKKAKKKKKSADKAPSDSTAAPKQ
jgi:hypothetical protein